LLAIIKKVLSGQIGKNLIDIEFSTQQVIESDEHTLLMKLRDSELKDDEAVIAERMKNFVPKKKELRGYLKRYASLVSSGAKGAILN